MGARGPIGKRSDQRLGHRSTAEQSGTVKAPSGARTRVPAADVTWHPIAKGIYNSLKTSGQSAFFEPSDWQVARLAAEVTSQMLYAEKLSAMLLAAVDGMWARLLVTEADRRRLKIELEKPKEDTAAKSAVSFLDDARKRLTS